MILARLMNTSRESSLAARSRYRLRYRVSTLVRPWYFSGMPRSDLLRSSQEVMRRLSSPRRVRIMVPSAPTKSPRSTCSSAA